MPDSSVVVTFAKYPAAGQVKTRLIGRISAAEAANLYRAGLVLTLECLELVPGIDTILAASPDESDFSDIVGPKVKVVPQGPGDLGERMNRVIGGRFAEGYQRVVAIGGDCPGMLPSDVIAAFTQLEIHDTVIGPAIDGGYYLLGLRRPAPILFDSIPWGSDRVARQTRAIARSAGLSMAELPRRRDFDEFADLAAILDELPDDDIRLGPFKRLVGRLVIEGDQRVEQ